jgi:hypothetical protein
VLEGGEEVSAVIVVAGDGSERTLEAGDYYLDRTTGLLTVDPEVLAGSGSRLNVQVSSGCVPEFR